MKKIVKVKAKAKVLDLRVLKMGGNEKNPFVSEAKILLLLLLDLPGEKSLALVDVPGESSMADKQNW